MTPALGMPALIELASVEENVGLCRELGLSFVELNMNMPYCCPECLDGARLRSISEESGIAFTLHLPEEIDLASFHRQVREGHLERCIEAVEWAHEAGIGLVNMHLNSGIYYTLPDRQVWIYGQYAERFTSNLLSSFSSLLALGKKYGIKVCIENAYNFHYPFIAAAIDRLVGLDGLFLTWDVGHDARSGFKESRVLLKNQAKIAHVHLHDFNGKSDHQVLFTGDVDIKRVMALAEARSLSVVVETKTADALAESINRLKMGGLI